MHSCSSLCDLSTLFSNRNSLSQSASSWTGRCHSIRDAIPYEKPYNIALRIYFLPNLSASSSVSISSLPRLIHQFTRDIASCLCELWTFKECCGLHVVVVLNKLLVVPPHVSQGLHCQLAVVYDLIYYSYSQYM